MSRLEDLLQTLCPDGVEYKKLGQVCKFVKGKGLSKGAKGLGDVPIILYGELYTTYGDYITEVISHTSEDLVISSPRIHKRDLLLPISSTTKEAQIGKASVYLVDKPAYLGGDAILLRHEQNAGYLMYLLNSNWFEKNKMKCVFGTTINHLHPSKLSNIYIPVPPMSVQKEIVRILDTFSGVVTELEAEHAARVRQYEHYRNELLSFSNAQFQLQTVGEVCETITDYVAAGSFADLRNKVTYKSQPDFAQLVRTTDLKNNFRNNGFVYVAESAFKYLWRVNLNEESIILPNIGNCGEVYYVLPENLPNKHNVLGPNAILVRSRKVNNKFLSYLFLTHEFQTQLMKITSPTGQTKFNKTDLKRLVLPIPSREVQEQIVSILDRFDALVNDLKSGLPAEIALRRKQYEYYRDKLLTFQPLE